MNAVRSHISNFEQPGRQEFVLCVQGPFICDRHGQVLGHRLLRDAGIRPCGQVDPSRRETIAAGRSRNNRRRLPRIRQTRGRQPGDYRRAVKRRAVIAGVVARDHFVEETPASTHDPSTVRHRLPGESNSRSKVGPRRVVPNDIIDGIPINAIRGCALVIARDNKTRQTASCSRGSRSNRDSVNDTSRSGIRHRVEQAGPDVREVSIVFGGPAVIFPSKSKVQRQSRIELEIILNESVEIGDPPCIRNRCARRDGAADAAGNTASRRTIRVSRIGCTTSARSGERGAAGPTDEEVRPSRKCRITNRTTIVVGCVLDTHQLEAGPERVLAVRPGNLVSELVLIGDHGSAVLILPTHRHPAGNAGAGRRANRYARQEIDPGPQIRDTHLRIFERSENVVIDGVTLVCRVDFIHEVGRQNRR